MSTLTKILLFTILLSLTLNQEGGDSGYILSLIQRFRLWRWFIRLWRQFRLRRLIRWGQFIRLWKWQVFQFFNISYDSGSYSDSGTNYNYITVSVNCDSNCGKIVGIVFGSIGGLILLILLICCCLKHSYKIKHLFRH